MALSDIQKSTSNVISATTNKIKIKRSKTCQITKSITKFNSRRDLAANSKSLLIFSLFAYTPFSKLAHLVYRTVAMTYAEYTNRK